MKSIILGLMVSCAILSSCSTHFSRIYDQDVTLYLVKPQATDVVLFSSLDGYQGKKLRQQNGVWELTLPSHQPFKYFYRIDGENFTPSCLMTEKDDFGMKNCIFEPKS